ncbi:hypothetical protein GCM10007977_024840 [Dactylosporangium sucinum]|uniref:RNA polymerase sigma factor 70 region 4 type 2 domain-containing protein n=1 Tax=Dactylosporangium sucinum TaxID=1424081 RepID=A0A917TGJ3_9ACTN|nr:hypothetical protein GCM10007977_024840 [Dactylosporangium sucinum]
MVQADKGLAQAPPEPRAETLLAEVGDYDDFFDSTYPLLLQVAMASGASPEEADDAAEEVMSYLYRRWGEITQPRAYARRAVLNAVAKAKKRDAERLGRTVAGGHVTPEADDGTDLCAWENREWVLQHLNVLPPAQRAVMAGVVDDLSTAELAEALGKTEPTIRKNLQWARERLKIELAKERQRERQVPSGTETRRETR